jgi:hypothetical protein
MTKARGCQHAGFGPFGFLTQKPKGNKGGSSAVPALMFDDEFLSLLGSPGHLMDDESRDSPDSPLPAGYTFFAQFLDHDVTLDTQSDLNRPGQDPTKLRNQRTSSLDLDCVYGLGPEANPHLYDQTRTGFLATGADAGRPWDLARTETGAALIGDPRNDENLFVGQMQLLFIEFHNAMMLANLSSGNTAGERFEEVETSVRHHYQYIILYDFLCRVCHRETYDFAVARIEDAAKARRKALEHDPHGGELPSEFPFVFRHSAPDGSMPMPIEFSVAAYRFGHTTVRDAYPANAAQLDIELFDERFGTLGFSAVPQELAVDWRLQLEVDPCIDPVQAKAFDHLLPNELMAMPDTIVGRTSPNNRSLAFRNLARGRSLGLASGEALAEFLSPHYSTISTLSFDQLFEPSDFPGKAGIANRARELAEKAGGTPLFFYLMREAELEGNSATLGPLGSAILLEVFGRMLIQCTTSFFFKKEGEHFVDFKPEACVIGEERECCTKERKEAREHFKARYERVIERLNNKFKDASHRKDASTKPCDPDLELADIVRFVNSMRDKLNQVQRPAALSSADLSSE